MYGNQVKSVWETPFCPVLHFLIQLGHRRPIFLFVLHQLPHKDFLRNWDIVAFYNVMLVSATEEGESAVGTHISPPSGRPTSPLGHHRKLWRLGPPWYSAVFPPLAVYFTHSSVYAIPISEFISPTFPTICTYTWLPRLPLCSCPAKVESVCTIFLDSIHMC